MLLALWAGFWDANDWVDTPAEEAAGEFIIVLRRRRR